MEFYIPNDIPMSYRYIVPNTSGNYYDLYNTDTLQPNRAYTYYRFYNYLDQSLYTTHTRNITGSISQTLNVIEVTPTYSYTARKDYPDIVFTSAILIIGFVALFNIITSIIKKGGLFSGLL